MNRVELVAPDGVPEIVEGDDLAALVQAAVELADGDVVVVTSKVVSKAEGRVLDGSREDVLAAETARVVGRRGGTTIVRTHHGLTLAAAGVDASNVEAGRVVLLPKDPDASARRLRAGLAPNVGVVVTDTAGRPWRTGQTDIAVGAAGIRVSEDFAGRHDSHGNELAVTLPAVADEIAGAAELVQGKLSARPFAVLRGRPDLVLPRGEDGEGARALVRPEASDLFGYGAREAVVRALAAGPDDRAAFGDPAEPSDLARALADACATVTLTTVADGLLLELPPDAARAEVGVRAVCFAHGWMVEPESSSTGAVVRLRARPVTP